MNNETKVRIMQEACRIGDHILKKSIKDEKGISWETMNLDDDHEIYMDKAANIYKGVAGITLFLLELYKQTGKKKYLKAVTDSADWLIHQSEIKPGGIPAFLTGRFGVAFTLIKVHQISKNECYLEKGLKMAKDAVKALDLSNKIDDLINGTSGVLLSLLHLHAATKEDMFLEAMDLCIKRLIEHAHQGKKGLYWDRSSQHIGGLCGYSHGAGGIGAVFLELGKYLGNESFYWLAKQAFTYESYHFDKQRNNWPDLRKGVYSDEDKIKFREAYLADNLDFFTIGGDMSAWCHGAPGVGLSRVRAYEILKDPQFKEDALRAIEKTIITTVETKTITSSFNLCHGRGGNSDLFIDAYNTFKDPKYLELAEQVAQEALSAHKELGYYVSGLGNAGEREDTSLFLGNAGIGYYLLRVLAPKEVPSVTSMTLDAPCPVSTEKLSKYPHISISLAEIKEKLVNSYFPRTLALTNSLCPTELKVYFQNHNKKGQENGIPLNLSFSKFASDNVKTMAGSDTERLAEAFLLEQEKDTLDRDIISHAYLQIKTDMNSERAEELIKLPPQEIFNLRLIMEPNTKIFNMQWNWTLEEEKNWTENFTRKADDWLVLLIPSPQKVLEIEISPFSYTILRTYEEGNGGEKVMKEVFDAFETLTPEEEEIIREKTLDQIKQALQSGILIELPQGEAIP